MAKDKERQLAQFYYVKHNMTPKQIAEKLGINIKTVYSWIKKYNWNQLRTAEITKPQRRIENITEIINQLAEQRLNLTKQLEKASADEAIELRKQIAQIDAAVANWNKTLTTIDKENKVSIFQFLTVMEKIFDELKLYNHKLYLETIEFQEYLLNKIKQEYEAD